MNSRSTKFDSDRLAGPGRVADAPGAGDAPRAAAADLCELVAEMTAAGWIRVCELAPHVAGRTLDAAKTRLRRLCFRRLEGLGLARKTAGVWLIHPTAEIDGRSARIWLEAERQVVRPLLLWRNEKLVGTGMVAAGRREQPRALPSDFGSRPGDQARYDDTVELLRRVYAFMVQHSRWPAARCWAGVTRRFSRWAKVRGLRCDPRRLREYRARVDPFSGRFDGNLDRRGCHKRPRRCSDEAWTFFAARVADPSEASLVSACSKTEVEAKRRGWRWYASARTAQSRAMRDLVPSKIRVKSMVGRRRRRRGEKR